jgi:hypothetical protein
MYGIAQGGDIIAITSGHGEVAGRCCVTNKRAKGVALAEKSWTRLSR